MREKLIYFLFFSKILQNKRDKFLFQREESISLITHRYLLLLFSPMLVSTVQASITTALANKKLGIALDLGLLYRTLKHVRREGERKGGKERIISGLQWLLELSQAQA